jgi:hypothetical protein
VTIRLLEALNVQHRDSVREILVLATAHQLPQLAVEDLHAVLAAFPPRAVPATDDQGSWT